MQSRRDRPGIKIYKDISLTPNKPANLCAFNNSGGVSRPKTVTKKKDDSKAEVISNACDMYNEMYAHPSSRANGYPEIADSVQEPRDEVEVSIEEQRDDDEQLVDDDLIEVLESKARGDDETAQRKRIDEQLFSPKGKSPLAIRDFGATPSTAKTKIIRPGDSPPRDEYIVPIRRISPVRDEEDSDIEAIVHVLPATPPKELRRSKRRAILDLNRPQYADYVPPPRKQRPRAPSKPVILPPIPEDLKQLYESLGFENHSGKQRTDKFGPLKITGADIHTLRRNVFTNDTIIDEYLKLICERSQQDEITFRKSFALCSYFHTSLRANGSQTVRSWIKEKLTDYELIFVPLNTEEHWYLFIIDMINRTTFIYDSIYGDREFECEELRKFFKSFIGDAVEWDDWATIPAHNQQGPTQTNSTDCGIFLCQYAECLSRNVEPDFCQSMMTNFRIRMRYELLTGKLLPPPPSQPTDETN
uniref:ULP_PROTEASE domain-containing protein n=1 Tax=Panagrellus redivivus TaxID=6233 RepID=A0A7E4W7T3_PANRE